MALRHGGGQAREAIAVSEDPGSDPSGSLSGGLGGGDLGDGGLGGAGMVDLVAALAPGSEDVLREVVADARSGIAVFDGDLRCRYANAAFARATGADGQRERSLAEVLAALPGAVATARQVLADGIPRECDGGPPAAPPPGMPAAWLCRFRRLELADRAAAVVVELTDLGAEGPLRELATDRARLALLNEASERIGSKLDVEATSAELARFVVPRFAQLAGVEILPPEAVQPGETVRGGPIRALRTALEAVPALRGRRGGPLPPGQWVRHEDECATSHCLGTGRAVADDGRPGHRVYGLSCEPTGFGPVLVVPLRARGHLIGALTLVRTAASAPFGRDETALIQELADRAAVSIDNARHFSLSQDLTLELQRALLAEPGNPHANLELASRYLPCGTSAMVGGDWFETIRLSFGRTLLVIGDVMGHGVEAAVDMSSYRSLLRYVAATDLPPHRILRQLDRLTSQNDATRPATCLLALVEPARHRCTYASAGHLPPALISADRPTRLVSVPTGPPLGTGLGDYHAAVHPLLPDQALLLYTDGLVERRTEDIDTSLARLTRLGFPHPSASLDDLLDHVLATVKPAVPDDDIAVLAARTL
ncbi:SpoIIE family protein phosphatase [Streptacidiphilus sp. EB129]|uniref:SpoIIE family protein phosphatase n=1 Tax=Streptacidiphilus sp. EB129 TaxID=3156262 RepID=UPI003511D550